jgi:hypothetical protein
MFLPSVLPTLSRAGQVYTIFVVFCPYMFLFLSCYVDPGYILNDTLDLHGSLYPYDHTLFLPGQMCSTCRLPKPPRSKHCSICGFCVAKADHHCVFINGCVGYGNQHWFLLLLLSTAILTSTGAWLGTGYLLQLVRAAFPAFTIQGSGLSWSEYFSFWSWGMSRDPKVGSIALLCLLTSPLVWGLLLYNVYLTHRGMTTNESGKWSDFQFDLADGYLFRRHLSPTRQRDSRFEPEVVGWPKSSEYVYTRTYDGLPETTMDLPGEGHWHKDFKLEDVENIYDIGFLQNLRDIFLPRKYLMVYSRTDDSRFP